MFRPKTFVGLLLIASIALAVGTYATFEFNEEPSNVFPEFLTTEEKGQLRDELFRAAYTCLDHPLRRAVVLRMSLEKVSIASENQTSSLGGEARNGRRSTPPSGAALQPDALGIRRYDAVIRFYTLFAIPIGEVMIHESTNIFC